MDILLENLKDLTTIPKNVAQLKKIVLQLAVQGKLTVKWREENPDVESAAALLKKIKTEKEKLFNDGKLKREKPLKSITENEMPFLIPDSWQWCRTSNLSILVTKGSSPKWQGVNYIDSQKDGILFITSENVGDNELLLFKRKYVESKFNQIEPRSILKKGDILTNIVGASIGRTTIYDIDEIANINQAVCLIRILDSFTSKQYLISYLNSPSGINYMLENQFAPGRANLSLDNISNLILPLPPFAEQLAIVSKVESLFAQIDHLHELASKKASIIDNSAKSLFGKINTTTDKQDLQQTWQLLTSNFNTVTRSIEGVNQLRQTILQLAFQGKLTTKWRTENPDVIPANALLEKIKAEKQQLIKEGKLRKELHLHKIAQNEQPFEIPVFWEWDRMGAISQHNSGKTLDSGRNKGELHKYITTSNLYWGYFKLDNVKSFLISDNELDRCSAIKGDLLICEGGEAGRTAVWEESYSICFQNHIHRVRLYGNINPYFVFRYFQKLNFSGEINEYRKGMGISNMSSGSLTSIPIPIPPIAEQEVIVSNINHLMSLCDELEKKIEKRDSYQERIMQAVVKQAFVV